LFFFGSQFYEYYLVNDLALIKDTDLFDSFLQAYKSPE